MDVSGKDYIVVVQCHIAMERCSGFLCEKSFTERRGGFASLPADKPVRILYMTCGGCCGKATLRKLENVKMNAKKHGVPWENILVQLASCMTKDNYHSPRCPHTEFIKELVARSGLDCAEDTVISGQSEKRRQQGLYGRS